jgi:pimeloyl-ACP methyl ester carboxylesterase
MSVSSDLGTEREVRIGESTIRYRESGSGRPVVFVHGFLVNGDLWRKVVPELSGEFRCITPDWPLGSHTEPMAENADLSPQGVSKLIGDFLEALDLEDVLLVGNDSGGALCQLVVTEHPERITGLVLTPCDCFEKFPPFPYSLIRYSLNTPVVRSLLVQSMRLRATRYLSFRPLMKHGYDSEIVRSWAEPALRDKRIQRDTMKFGTQLNPKVTKAVAERLPEVEMPVLIVWPPKCTFFTFELAQRLEKSFANAEIVEIPDAWTFLPEDKPEELGVAITQFARAGRPIAIAAS